MTPKLEFAFQIRLDLGPATVIENAACGGRGFRPVQGGEITGPLLQGTVQPGTGGDYPLLRRDGVAAFDARYWLLASDGTPILLRNRGYRHGPPDVMSRLASGQEADGEYYMRLSPEFEVQEGPHAWLARHVFVGTGTRHTGFAVHRYFVVR